MTQRYKNAYLTIILCPNDHSMAGPRRRMRPPIFAKALSSNNRTASGPPNNAFASWAICCKALPIDTALGQHELHGLVIHGIDLVHAQQGGTFGLKQPAHVTFKRHRDVSSAGDEKRRERRQMRAEGFRKALQGLFETGGGVFTTLW